MKNALKAGLVASLGSLSLVGAAHAEVPAAITTALGTIGTDASSVATTILVALVIVFAIKFLRKGF